MPCAVFHTVTVEKQHKTLQICVLFTGTFPWLMHIHTQVNKPLSSGRLFKISTSYIVHSLCLELKHNELRISAVQMFTDSTKPVILQAFTLFTSHEATKTNILITAARTPIILYISCICIFSFMALLNNKRQILVKILQKISYKRNT